MAVGFLTQPLVRNCHTLCLLNGDGWSWMIMDGDGLVATWCSSEQLAPGCQILLPQVLTSTTLVKANPRESKMSKMSKPVVLQKQVKESTSAPAGNSPTGLLMAGSALGKFRLEGRC